MKNTTNRRFAFKKLGAGVAAFFGLGLSNAACATISKAKPEKKVVGDIIKNEQDPLFSSAVAYGDLLFIAGKGAHFEGDIKAHTDR